LVGKRGRRPAGSTVFIVHETTTKSSVLAGEAKGDDWRLEVEDDQRKYG
jgi:subtilisin-like proprotein convertase family protein